MGGVPTKFWNESLVGARTLGKTEPALSLDDRIARNIDQFKLLKEGIDGDDDRADADEIQVEEEALYQHQIALATSGYGAGEDEWEILNKMF